MLWGKKNIRGIPKRDVLDQVILSTVISYLKKKKVKFVNNAVSSGISHQFQILKSCACLSPNMEENLFIECRTITLKQNRMLNMHELWWTSPSFLLNTSQSASEFFFPTEKYILLFIKEITETGTEILKLKKLVMNC